jgi:hypothetical protein
VAEELRLDEHGEEQLQRRAFNDAPTRDQSAFVDRVLDGLSAKRPYGELGVAARDLTGGGVAITCLDDATIPVVVLPWPGQEDTFSLGYVGDFNAL